jgi:formate--tetrahydrofolate ligase
MTYADYVVTEAGFGADLGAEKFYNIKCRKSGLQPKLTVIVATTQGLKMHGGVALEGIKQPNEEGLRKGFENLDKHIENLQRFGQSVVVCFNRYATDTDEEIALCRAHCEAKGVGFAVNNAFTQGGEGAVELAELVVKTIEQTPSQVLEFSYDDHDSVEVKAEKVAKKVYGADGVIFSPQAKKMIERIKELGVEHFPICVAKTQYSFSADAKAYGVAKDFELNVRDVVINNGAEMIVVIMGDIMRMPGLPKVPQAQKIDIVDGNIEGLS